MVYYADLKGRDMELENFSDPDAFLLAAGDYLLAREARHNMFFGVIDSAKKFPDRFSDIYMAVVRDQDVIVAAGLMTPPHNLLLSDVSNTKSIGRFVDDLARQKKIEVSGVVAAAADSITFALAYGAVAGKQFKPSLRMRIYQLDTVRPVQGIPGSMRPASAGERDLLTDWFIAFEREALNEEVDRARVEKMVNNYLGLDWPRLFVWEDSGNVASMTARTGPTPNGMRINSVYTPPALRKRGYASALVAGVSQSILDSGKRFCFLFTDLGNPTSNHIYQEIGYQEVCDVEEYKFS
jgi:predicted GNAT family acetyltransferase